MSRNTLSAYGWGMALAAVMSGCASSSGERAPVIDHSTAARGGVVQSTGGKPPVQRERDWRPQVYVVQKGDTLYSIALNFGFDYRELAALNGIENPAVIKVGQEIRLFPAAGATATTVAVASKPAPGGKVDIKSQPAVGKLAYSEQAVAQIEKMQPEMPKAEVKPVVVTAVATPPSKPEPAGDAEVEDVAGWGLPATGKVIAGFSESQNRKGVDIAGKLGQPVYASAAGKVVYSGSGLRGYGKLIIIKHNNTYLSAYAHNAKLLMKEGESVGKGQKIAEMGNTDADRVELHFEIRRLGKPVDPAKYIPLPKS